MVSIVLGLLVFSNVLVKGLCRFHEVHYEVNDFGELAEARFQIKHGIVKRAVDNGTVSTTSHPRTTKSVFHNSTRSAKPTSEQATKPTHISSNATDATPRPPTATLPLKENTTTSLPPMVTTPVLHTATTPTVNNAILNGTNITIYQDDHDYFTSQYYPSGESWWFDLHNGPVKPKLHVNVTNHLLYSDTITTKFTFPYYGHEVNEVTITNKGYLFLGEKFHTFNASMQYVAPLMADFGSNAGKVSYSPIHYVDTGDRFTVEWSNLRLQNQKGEFSFQCSILKNGTIVFAYKKIPISVNKIKNDTFPVRVGLSDSYVLRYFRRGLYFINGRWYNGILLNVYYRYHQIKLKRKQVKDGSAFVISPLPNCVLFKSCDSCVNSKTQFSCRWCPRLRRCSDGFDRHRHSWLVNRCNKNSITSCPSTPTPKTSEPQHTSEDRNGKIKVGDKSSSNKHAATAVIIVFCLLFVIAIASWIMYAYTHPLSRSGMFLIQYGNPAKWCRNSKGRSSGSGGKITFKSMSAGDSTA